MLKTMRQNTKIVMWILVGAFVGLIALGWGADITGRRGRARTSVGKIGGRRISYEEFRKALQQTYALEKRSSDVEPDQGELVRRVWDDFVNQILLFQEIKKHNIGVTDREVDYYNRKDPPQFVQALEIFQTDGKFDSTKYEQFLGNPATYNDPRARQLIFFAENTVRDVLLRQKLQERIIGSVKVTDPEVRKNYIDQNEKVRVKYVFLEANSLSDSLVSVSSEEIENYYMKHQSEFKQEAQRRCDYVVFEKKPTPSDEKAVEEEIKSLLAQARAGVDFAELAQENSDDPGSAAQGGDLGFFGREQMVKPFEEAAFALKVGEISEPVKTRFGWHIIKLEGRKIEDGEEKIRARHILLKVEPSRTTIDEIFEKAERFMESAKEGDFWKLAEAEGLEVRDTGFFGKGSFIPGVGIAQSLVNLAFESEVGDVLRVYENNRGFFILRLTDKRQAGVRPLSEVSPAISRIIMRDKKIKLARQQLQKVADLIAQGATLEEVAQADTLEVEEPAPFARSGYVPGVGSRNEFIGAAFRLEVGEVSDIVETAKGAYIIQLMEKQPIDEEKFQEEKDELKARLLEQKRSETFNTWFANLRRNAQIVDNRHLFYDF